MDPVDTPEAQKTGGILLVLPDITEIREALDVTSTND
jgi:hypothetical protein